MTEKLRSNRAFVLLSSAQAIRGIAFWHCWLGLLTFAAVTLNATPGQIALITAFTSLPIILFSPFSGAVVDRTNGKWVFACTLLLNAITAFLMIFVTHVWQLYPIVFAWASSGAFVWPALGSLIKQITSDETMVRGTGIVNSVWEATLIVGSPVAGLLAEKVGARVPMEVGSVLYLIAFAILLPMRFTPSRAPKPAPGTRLGELRQGLTIIMRLQELRALALWGAIAWGGFNVIIAVEPFFVRHVMHGGQSMLGWFYGVGGIGSTLGAILVGWRGFKGKELRIAAIGLIFVGFFFVLYISIARWPYVLPIQFFIGMGFSVYQTLTQVLIQRRSPNVVVGRALAAKRGIEETSGFSAALVAGAIATSFGARKTMLASGAVIFLSATTLLVRSKRRVEEEPAQLVSVPMEFAGIDPLHDRASVPIPTNPHAEQRDG
ncbi:MAG: MFS transporter [Actinomycetota bacterium]